MKKLLFIAFLTTINIVLGQEKIVKSNVSSATVFLNSAQVSRTKSIDLSKGENTLKFINLSPFVDQKSIQVKASNIEIQAISFKKDYLKTLNKNPKVLELEKNLDLLNKKINSKEVYLNIVREETQFLKANINIGGKNQTLSVTTLKEATAFYSSKIKSLKLEEFKLENEIKELKTEVLKIRKQINDFTPVENFGSGEITIKLKSKFAGATQFKLSYNVSNAGWYPSYDVRAKDINSPLELVYKANLKQNTKVDWNNVKLRFSSANPSNSTRVKKVIPYFLDYGTFPPNYKSTPVYGQISGIPGRVSGKVMDSHGGLPGTSVIVKGTTIVTDTDFDGNYSLELPSGMQTLVFSYLGYKTQERVTNGGSLLNITMEEDSNTLDEIVVTGYSSRKKRRKESKIDGVMKKQPMNVPVLHQVTKSNLETKDIINQTTVSFEVLEPYTIKSSTKSKSIPVKTHVIDAKYQYFSFPKANANAYLVASLSDWEKLNLLEGEANIYFEDTFIGTSLIDTRVAKKELELSLGADKNVVVERKKEKGFISKQFIGSKQEETRVWNFSVKNNKNQKINITVFDQVPISKRDDIKVELDDKITTGTLDTETGKVKWETSIQPKNSFAFKFKYSVKYPKNTTIRID